MRFSLAFILACATPAFGGLLVFSSGATDVSNTVQAQNTILQLTSPGSATNQSACVLIDDVLLGTNYEYSPCPTGFAGGNQANSQTRTFSAQAANIASPADLRLTLDVVEPNGALSITIDRLELYFWNPATGALLSTIALSPQPYILPTSNNGNGKAEVVFRLDSAAITELTLAGFNANTIIGMAVNMSNATGGPESFYLTNQLSVEGVPEPSTWVLGATALGLLCWNKKKRGLSSRLHPQQECSTAPGVSVSSVPR